MSAKITNGTTETVTLPETSGRFLLHTSGTFGAGTLVLALNGAAMEDGTFTDNVSREVVISGVAELQLSGATDVTVYFDRILY